MESAPEGSRSTVSVSRQIGGRERIGSNRVPHFPIARFEVQSTACLRFRVTPRATTAKSEPAMGVCRSWESARGFHQRMIILVGPHIGYSGQVGRPRARSVALCHS